MEENQPERDRLGLFLNTLVTLDAEHLLRALVKDKFSGAIRTLLDNPFVFNPFWRALRDHDSSGAWEDSFCKAKHAAMLSLMGDQIATTLAIVFDRLYVLRDQLVHGGATWNSKVNRQQVRDAAQLMECLVPAVLSIMLDHPDADFGALLFPVVG